MMKCFTVDSRNSTYPFIPIAADPYPHIAVGENGRGRNLERFPVGRRFFESLTDEHRVNTASVIKTQKGTLLLVEERVPDLRRALVLVTIPGGFRGSTEWTAATRKTVPCPHQGEKHAEYGCGDCGVKYPADQNRDLFWTDANIHPDKGNIFIYDPFPFPGVTVLAEGYGAEGDAGRAGGPHWHRLIIMEPDACIRIRKYGRLYGGPSAIYVVWDGMEVRAGTRDEIWPPSEEESGEVI